MFMLHNVIECFIIFVILSKSWGQMCSSKIPGVPTSAGKVWEKNQIWEGEGGISQKHLNSVYRLILVSCCGPITFHTGPPPHKHIRSLTY